MAESIHQRRHQARAEHFGLTEQTQEEPEVDEVDEYHVGGGWYEIDGEKYHGKEAAREALGG